MSAWAARVVSGPRGFLLRTRGSAPAAAPALSPALSGAGNGDNSIGAVRGNPLSETPQNAPSWSHPEAGRKQSASQEEEPDLGRDWERAEPGRELGACRAACPPLCGGVPQTPGPAPQLLPQAQQPQHAAARAGGAQRSSLRGWQVIVCSLAEKLFVQLTDNVFLPQELDPGRFL